MSRIKRTDELPKRPYPPWQRRHEGVLLYLLKHPSATLAQCAQATGYSPSKVRRITCSHGFNRCYDIALEVSRDEAVKEHPNREQETKA